MLFKKDQRLRHALKLIYPLHITWTADGFHGRFPDLPGCEAKAEDLPELHRRLFDQRRNWLYEAVTQERDVPVPNSHLDSERA